jgi:trimethylamine:corrinoid methyltransferase-like protein
MDRKMFDLWEKTGAKEIRGVLNEKAREIFEGHRPEELSEDRVNAIGAAVARHRPDV